jgi:hypothetical protein
MASFNFSDLIKKAEDAGYTGGVDLPNGTYDVTVNTTNASETKAGDEQVGVHFTATSGAGTVWDNHILNEDPVRLAIFFDNMGRLGLGKQWFLDNSPTMEQIAETLKSAGPFRIEKSVRKSKQGTEFPKIKILGPASGGADVVSAGASAVPAALPTVQAPVAPVPPVPAVEAPSPPTAAAGPVAPAAPVAPPAPAVAASDAPAPPWPTS